MTKSYLSQEWKTDSIQKVINAIYHTGGIQNRYHMVTSTGTEEQHMTKPNTTQELVKTLQKLGAQENFLNLIKGT